MEQINSVVPGSVGESILKLREQTIVARAREVSAKNKLTQKLVRQRLADNGIPYEQVDRTGKIEVDENTRSQILDEIVPQHGHITSNSKYNRFLRERTALSPERVQKYIAIFVQKTLSQEFPEQFIAEAVSKDGVQMAKKEIADLLDFFEQQKNATINIETKERILIDANFMLNDTPLDNETVNGLNQFADHPNRFEIESLSNLIQPCIDAVEKIDFENSQFLFLGDGSKITVNGIAETRPDLAEKIGERVIRIYPVRTLDSHGKPSIAITPEDLKKLEGIAAENLYVIEDVVSSGKTIFELKKALNRTSSAPKTLNVIAPLLAKRSRQIIPQNTNIIASALIERTDREIPPINTLSTLIAQKTKGQLAVPGLEEKGYLEARPALMYLAQAIKQAGLESLIPTENLEREIKVHIIKDRFGLTPENARFVLQCLQKLAGKDLVMSDRDGTIGHPSGENIPNSLRKLDKTLAEREQIAFLLHSNSPESLLHRDSADLKNAQPFCIAENGAALSFKNGHPKSINLTVKPELFPKCEQLRNLLIQEIQAQLGDNVLVLSADDASQQVESGKIELPENNKSTVVVMNTGRKASLGIYVRNVDQAGNITGTNPEILSKLTQLASAHLNNGFSEFGAKAYPDMGSLLIRDREIQKTSAVEMLLNLLAKLGIKPRSVSMIGNEKADVIRDPRVKTFAVANANQKLKNLAHAVSNKELVDGVIDIIHNHIN